MLSLRTDRSSDAQNRGGLVLRVVLSGWLLASAFAACQPAAPFTVAARRLSDVVRARPVADPGAAVREIVSAMDSRLPPRGEVAIWVERVPRNFDEIVQIGEFWYAASYLLYPRRVFPLAAPDVTAQLERQGLVTPALAAVMYERAGMLSRDTAGGFAILAWDRTVACPSRSLSAWPGVRLEAMLPRGACLLAAGGHDH